MIYIWIELFKINSLAVLIKNEINKYDISMSIKLKL